MLPNVRNQQTISILNKLKEQGPPAQGEVGSVSLDMTMPPNDASGEENILQPVQPASKKGQKRVTLNGPSGT